MRQRRGGKCRLGKAQTRFPCRNAFLHTKNSLVCHTYCAACMPRTPIIFCSSLTREKPLQSSRRLRLATPTRRCCGHVATVIQPCMFSDFPVRIGVFQRLKMNFAFCCQQPTLASQKCCLAAPSPLLWQTCLHTVPCAPLLFIFCSFYAPCQHPHSINF